MGLLDDAIREHLELKRRRGADPAEIERLEREALGPARGTPEPPGAVLDHEPAHTAYEDEPGQWAEDLEEPEEWEYAEPAVASSEPPESPGGLVGEREPIAGDLAAAEYAEAVPEYAEAAPGETQLEPELEQSINPHPAPVPPPGPAVPPAEAAAEAGGETVEYDVEAEHAAEEAGGEDVLEETPEFLQDTPDHDRLWFEQRPPKDFDFDG